MKNLTRSLLFTFQIAASKGNKRFHVLEVIFRFSAGIFCKLWRRVWPNGKHLELRIRRSGVEASPVAVFP